MKKFTLTLLLIFGTVSALFAQQSVREDIFAFLKREGYVPTFDEDRDILFKVQGINYYAIIKEVADMVCKCSAERDGEDNCFKVAMEFITNNRTNTEYQMAHALRLLPGWIEKFKEELD